MRDAPATRCRGGDLGGFVLWTLVFGRAPLGGGVLSCVGASLGESRILISDDSRHLWRFPTTCPVQLRPVARLQGIDKTH